MRPLRPILRITTLAKLTFRHLGRGLISPGGVSYSPVSTLASPLQIKLNGCNPIQSWRSKRTAGLLRQCSDCVLVMSLIVSKNKNCCLRSWNATDSRYIQLCAAQVHFFSQCRECPFKLLTLSAATAETGGWHVSTSHRPMQGKHKFRSMQGDSLYNL